jgi:hypothetical protein
LLGTWDIYKIDCGMIGATGGIYRKVTGLSFQLPAREVERLYLLLCYISGNIKPGYGRRKFLS